MKLNFITSDVPKITDYTVEKSGKKHAGGI